MPTSTSAHPTSKQHRQQKDNPFQKRPASTVWSVQYDRVMTEEATPPAPSVGPWYGRGSVAAGCGGDGRGTQFVRHAKNHENKGLDPEFNRGPANSSMSADCHRASAKLQPPSVVAILLLRPQDVHTENDGKRRASFRKDRTPPADLGTWLFGGVPNSSATPSPVMY